jgi:glutathione peroxidase
MSGFYDISIERIDGTADLLGALRGKVTLAVNVASQCGLTPQYQGLEDLQRELAGEGFTIVGFPCNQFGGQEPGDAKQIADFCESKYDVTFPMFSKIDVNGFDAHPLYNYLKKEKSGLLGPSIKWNFTKFLVDREGRVVARHAPTATPEGLKKEIEGLL